MQTRETNVLVLPNKKVMWQLSICHIYTLFNSLMLTSPYLHIADTSSYERPLALKSSLKWSIPYGNVQASTLEP